MAENGGRPFGVWRQRLPWLAMMLAGLSLGVSFGWAPDHGSVMAAYLVACLYFLSLALGGVFFVLVQWATRAGWSVSIRRYAEHVMAVLPVMGLLLLPIGGHLDAIYPWARGEFAHAALPAWQMAYLQPGFVLARAAGYLVLWTAIAWWFRRGSLSQDATGDPAITRRLRRASAPALILYALSLTFAAFDWVMSIQSGWYSTMFGVYIFAGSAVGFLALLAVSFWVLPAPDVERGVIRPSHLHDVGKLLFGFVCFWAYIGFSQFMLIWYASLPEETVFYGVRVAPGWLWVSRLLALGHFVLPFFFLLSEDVKRNRVWLGAAGMWLLVMHYIDLYWLVMPTLRASAWPQWVDLTTLAGVGLVFLATLGLLRRQGAAVPVGDPRLPEALAADHP